MRRILRFCVGFPYVLIFGTFSHLDPDGRSVRLGPVKAWQYAWRITL